MKRSKNLYLYATTGIYFLMNLLFLSCQQDDLIDHTTKATQDRISFGLTPIDDSSTTKSSQNVSEHFVLRTEHSCDTLCVRVSTFDGIKTSASVFPNKTTRGAPVTDIGSDYGLYGVFCYIQSNSDKVSHFYMYNESVEYNGSDWVTSETYYWPGINYKLRFYAYAPQDNADLKLPDTSDPTVNPMLTYTVPASVQNQKDLLVAATPEVPGDRKQKMDLQFKHICTAVRFEAHTPMQLGTLRKITLKGIHGQGTYNMDTQTWSLDAATASYSVEPNVETGGTSSVITSGENTFMMVPQILSEGAVVEISFYDKLTNQEYTFNSPLKGEWVMGKTVTYKISISPNYELDFIEESQPQDAHYVIYPIKIKADPALTQGWTLTTTSDWITLRSDLTTLQKEGYWTWNERGEKSISGSSGGEITVYAFLDENITDATRDALLTLHPRGAHDGASVDFTISQMCPNWNGEIGAERIEENNGGPYPWGFKWDRVVTFVAHPKFSFPINLADVFGAYVFKSIAERYIKLYSASSYVSIECKDFLGVIYETKVKVYYSYLNELNGMASDFGDGLSNTIALYTHNGIGSVSEIEKQLRANAVGNFTETSTGGGGIDIENFAAKMCVKKNKFTKEIQTITEGGSSVTFDVATIKDADIVWYLPAKDELSLVFDPAYSYNGVYWTSTAYIDNINAYYVQGSASNYGDRMSAHKVRAFRRK